MEAQFALRSEASKWGFDSEPFGRKNFTEVDFPEFKEFGGSNTAGEEFALVAWTALATDKLRVQNYREAALREIAKLTLCWPTLDVRAATEAFEIRGCQPSPWRVWTRERLVRLLPLPALRRIVSGWLRLRPAPRGPRNEPRAFAR